MKRLVISTLLIGIILLDIVGCGNDDEELNKPIVEPTAPKLTKEDILGTWEVVSINRLTSEAFLKSPEGEDFEDVVIKIKQFHFVFSADDSWIINLEFESISNFPDNPPDPGVVLPDGKLDITGVWSGTYNIDMDLAFLTQKADVNLTSIPQDFIEKVSDGLTEEEAEVDFVQQFKDNILTPFKRSTATLKGNTLTLNIPGAKKMILEKH